MTSRDVYFPSPSDTDPVPLCQRVVSTACFPFSPSASSSLLFSAHVHLCGCSSLCVRWVFTQCWQTPGGSLWLFISVRWVFTLCWQTPGGSLWLFISVCCGCSHSAGRHRVDLCGCSSLCAVGVHTVLADTGWISVAVHLCVRWVFTL